VALFAASKAAFILFGISAHNFSVVMELLAIRFVPTLCVVIFYPKAIARARAELSAADT
jgi:hypothetical protein